MPDFKHLTDDFPKPPLVPLQGNDYSYSLWDTLTAKIKLVNVPWDIEYNNVVEFASVADRDAFFDGLTGYSVEFSSGFRNVPNEYIKLPTPAANVMQYNYCIIDYPVPPTSDKPLDYATNQIAYRRMLYFIIDTDDTAPSTTRILLELDTWQMFLKSVNINTLMLERGHYAVKQSASVTDYLSGPITHTDWLLEPEPFTLQHTKKGAQVINVLPAADNLVVCFFLPFDINNLTDFNSYADKTYNTAVLPTYDASDNLTSDIKFSLVNDDTYEPTISDTQGSNNFNGVYHDVLYCVRNNEFVDFINLLKTSYKYILNSIKQFYLLSSKYVIATNQQTITIDTNIHLYKPSCYNSHTPYVTLSTIFATYAAGITHTKLLTSPFATMEFIFPNGDKVEVETQSCSATVDFNIYLNLSDILSLRCMFNNINYMGQGNVNCLNYESNTAVQHSFIASEVIYKDIDIPMFYIKQKPYEYEKFIKGPERSATNEQIKTAYANAKRQLINSQGNALGRSATAKSNADAKANTAKSVNDESAWTNKICTLNSVQTNYDNITRANAATSANATAQQGLNTSITGANQSYNTNLNLINISRNMTATQASNDLQRDLATVAAGESIAQSIVGGISGNPTDLVGAALTAVSTAVGVVATTAKANAIISNNSGMYNASTVMDGAATTESNDFLTNKNTAQNTYIATATYNTVTASDTNAYNTYTAENANATTQYTTATNNNTAILTTELAVNTANKTLADNIANNDYAAGLDVAKNNVALEYLKNNFSITGDSSERCKYTGEYAYTAIEQYKGIVIRINVNGLKQDVLKQVDDYFTRYGYAAGGRLISTATLQVMKHYTYIQARDVIVSPISCNAKQAQKIKDILMRGCTVYSLPSDIGVYFSDN
ncbi:MAG: hypothetical protein IKD55_02285 [Sediminibacterium sp.]|nr:hypothetical protein [Sediminibacterium sp.]